MIEQGKIDELIARLDSATGPDRELDAAIMSTLFNGRIGEGQDMFPGMWWNENSSHLWAEPVTASIDAALALCERVRPGSHPYLSHRKDDWRAVLWDVSKDGGWRLSGDGDAATGPLVLCVAALNAKLRSLKDHPL